MFNIQINLVVIEAVPKPNSEAKWLEIAIRKALSAQQKQ
jgi:hypothetical protein